MAAPCKPRIRDIAILGFAFFATYFGAGNLIFPPLLGLNSGSSFPVWWDSPCPVYFSRFSLLSS